jgi:hypothetical protein
MQVSFEIAADLRINVGNTMTVSHEKGAYVAVDIVTGCLPCEGQPDTRQTLPILLKRSDARSIASAIMGAAAEL